MEFKSAIKLIVLATMLVLLACDFSPSGSSDNNTIEVTISNPSDNSTFDEGDSIYFSGYATTEGGGSGGTSCSCNEGTSPEPDIETYKWSSDIDGVLSHGSNAAFYCDNLTPDTTHTITLLATDSDGSYGVDVIHVTIRSCAPSVSITSPANNATYSTTDNISFACSTTAQCDASITNYTWQSNIDGTIGTTSSFSRALSQGTHTIVLIVTDSESRTAQDTVQITVTGPIELTEVGYYDTPGYAADVYVSAGYAYVADYSAGLCVIDVSDPSSPVYTKTYEMASEAVGVFISSGCAYVANNLEGLREINLSSDEERLCDTYGNAINVYVTGSYAYVADYDGGLCMIELSSFTEVGSCPITTGTGYAADVYVSGGHAYVAAYDGGFYIIDVIPSPLVDDILPIDDANAIGVYFSGGYAYVAADNVGLRIIEIQEYSSEVGYYDTPGNARGVYVSGNYAYVADGSTGLRVIDVSDPTEPIEVGFCDTPGEALRVFISGNYAYVADFGTGLRIIDISPLKGR